MPVYNVSQYLRAALDSATRQTLRDIEIICINDGSTDNSLDIVKEYAAKDKRIIVIDKPNGGYGHTMNVGIDAATGEYLGILETDDFISLTMFEDLYKIAVENDLDVARGDFYKFTHDEKNNMNLEYISFCHEPIWYNKIFNPSIEVDSSKVLINVWNGIYRISLLRKNNIRFHESPGASFQDNGFFWQVQIYAQRAMYINRPYYYYRCDNPNSSVKDPAKIWSMRREYDYIRDILVKDADIWHRYKNYFWLRRYDNYYFTEKLIAPEFKLEFILYISKEYKNALEAEELSPKLFSESKWSRVQRIMDNPEDYIQKRYFNDIVGQKTSTLNQKSEDLSKETHAKKMLKSGMQQMKKADIRDFFGKLKQKMI